jgi:sugar lactone lactonase YvrE
MAELIYDARNVVGESLVWDDRRARLVWVDIIGRRIHALDPATGRHESWQTPDRVTSIGLREDGGAIVGLERHIALWDWGGAFNRVCEVEPDLPGNRLNEGVVGPDGAFWVGTMQNNIADDDSAADVTEDAGRLYRYAPDGTLTRLTEDRFGITNTLVWPASDRLITSDTTRNALYAYRIDGAGQLSDRRTILEGYPRGLPDGSCLDAEGMIWTARVVGGACLTRMTPEGEVIEVRDLPCSWPTSCAFGGPNLGTLFVTSARFTMGAPHLAAHPQEGGLFGLTPGVPGRKAHRFGANKART